MRFSSRTPPHLTPNRLTQLVARLRADGRDLLDLTQSNPTRAGFDYPPELLAPLSDSAALQYDPDPLGLPSARRAVAADYARHGLDISPERIVLTASTSDAYSQLFKLLGDAGDEVLVPRPSYPLFEHLTQLDLLTARPYDLDYHGLWSIDFDSVERAVSDRTRAVLLVAPNNPTGSFVSGGELDRLAALCIDRGVAIIVDEVFADYELTIGARAAAGRAAARTDVLSFTLGGLSKSAGLPQVKLGWIVAAGPEQEVSGALERLELISDTYLAVSTPVQVAAPRLIAAGAALRPQIAERIVANYRALQARTAERSACTVLRADAGWSAVMQVPSFDREETLVLRLAEERGVLVHPGYFFDFPRESYLVVSLLPSPEVFDRGIDAVLRHLDC